jgi:hypothetical protein
LASHGFITKQNKTKQKLGRYKYYINEPLFGLFINPPSKLPSLEERKKLKFKEMLKTLSFYSIPPLYPWDTHGALTDK